MHIPDTASCVIVDDEPKASGLLQARLGLLLPELRVDGCYTHWEAALPVLRRGAFDVLFLDVAMPEKSGLDLLRLVPERRFEVVFVTAHAEHSLQAIKLSTSGYILKPIDDDELLFATQKALAAARQRRAAEAPDPRPQKIGVPGAKGLVYLDVAGILYLESLKGSTRVVGERETLTSSYNLGAFVRLLERSAFFQIHRSFLINLHHVRGYNNAGAAIMANGDELPVAREHRAEFLRQFTRVGRNDD